MYEKYMDDKQHFMPLENGGFKQKEEQLEAFKNDIDSLEKTEIHCELFEYSLQDCGTGNHLYEALSYTWGGEQKPCYITIKEQILNITQNLYTALLRLRGSSLERIIWVDAICINQEDWKERGQQVQRMAKIYSKAARVLVWLGETAPNSDIALEAIRIAAEDKKIDSLTNEEIQQAVLALLGREWFQRIWVSRNSPLYAKIIKDLYRYFRKLLQLDVS
jgi:hypothetical protein